MRPFQVWRHLVGNDPAADVLVHQEDDERFFLSVGLTRSERYVVIHLESKMTSEVHWIDAARPDATPTVVLPRRQGVEYDIDHAVLPGTGDVWLVRTNSDGATDFSLAVLPVGSHDPADLQVVVPHRPGTKLDSVDTFAGHVVLGERTGGLEHLRILPIAPDGTGGNPFGGGHVIEQPDPVYSLGGGANGEWETATYRFGYTSLVTPMSSVDYDVATGARTVVKVQPVRGYRAEDYRSERIWATAPDGTRIPISLVAPKDQPLDGSAPCLLYGYGSYEITVDPTFSPARVNLLERGFTFAIAHVRGGGEMGRTWYEEGRLGHKPNTFTDFIACAEHLVATGWTSPERLVARGGSAGGLLMGAIVNLRPDLWRAVVAEVPFVDVVTTMSDTSLPLTVTEWEEWGNPIDDPDAYRTMKSYSPYDNVVPGAYPALYVTGGLNDPRVGYWEPAKWVAKLRTARTDDRITLLRTEMGAGHQGASGRYEIWRDEARVQAFVLNEVGISE
jgi:oligopeptidase B